MNLRYKFWQWLFELAKTQKKAAYRTLHGMDSSCPRCKQWESDGITITNTDLDDGSIRRTCSACRHTWLSLFLPVGFVHLDGVREPKE